jgi:hypothetical protein
MLTLPTKLRLIIWKQLEDFKIIGEEEFKAKVKEILNL